MANAFVGVGEQTMENTMRRARLAIQSVIIAMMLSGAQRLMAGEAPSATPYRPTVSNPAALPAPGLWEFEAGFLGTRGGDSESRSSVPVLAKYAFSENIGVLVGGDGYVRLKQVGVDSIDGGGNTLLVLKLRHSLSDRSALGLEAGATLPTARSGLGSDHSDYTLTGIFSGTLASTALDNVYGLDVNLGWTRFGQADPNTSRNGLAWAVSLSRALDERWTLALEPSGNARSGTRGIAQLLGAVSYAIRRDIVVDGGVAFGVSSESIDRALFAGITVLLH
ncbi:MAG: transporter [Burkholderiales bacterium]